MTGYPGSCWTSPPCFRETPPPALTVPRREGEQLNGTAGRGNRWIIQGGQGKVDCMEQFFSPGPFEAGFPDLQICIFPHLREFLVFDARPGESQVRLLQIEEILGNEFFGAVEAEFSHALRHTGEFPFSHLMNLTMHFEETIREVAMSFILEHLGVRMHAEPGTELSPDDLPGVVVYVITGGAASAHSEVVLDALRSLLEKDGGHESLPEWEGKLTEMVARESEITQRLSREELAEAIRGDSPDYFTLWDNLN